MRDEGNAPTLTCVLMLIKYPEEGRVKSRLARHIGMTRAVELYRNFVIDLMAMIERSHMPLIILFHPEDALEKCERWLGKAYDFVPQKGPDLGARLRNGFAHAFSRGFSKALAMASDVPDLSKNVLREACDALDTYDAVIGPSPDGGYYLVGFKRMTFQPEVFNEVRWSRDTVYTDTLELFKNLKRHVHILPSWRDIDTLQDLRTFVNNHLGKTADASQTVQYLLQHSEMLNEVSYLRGLRRCQPRELSL